MTDRELNKAYDLFDMMDEAIDMMEVSRETLTFEDFLSATGSDARKES